MPKIKVKNIPSSTENRICSTHLCDSTCPLYKMLQLDDGDTIHCVKDCRYGSEETIVELSEKEFPTNREWLESLSDEELAAFYTHGVLIERYSPYPINIHQIVGSFMASEQGVKEWISKPCLYWMEEE